MQHYDGDWCSMCLFRPAPDDTEVMYEEKPLLDFVQISAEGLSGKLSSILDAITRRGKQ